MTTGGKIRTRRKQLGMSVDELAKKVGKNRATIYRYENDEIEMPASMLQPLADALNTSPDELMDWRLIKRDLAEREKKMDQILSQLDDGISSEGSAYPCILMKAPTCGGFMEYEFKVLLGVLYRINDANQEKEMHTIRALVELAAHLDAKSVEHLVSYGEYLVDQLRKKTGVPIEIPYQTEEAASPG